MTTKQELLNRVCTNIGADTFTIDDGSEEDLRTALIYPSILDGVIARRPWTFLKATELLDYAGEAEDGAKYEYLWDLPPDCGMIRGVFISGRPIEFDRYGDQIACDYTSAETIAIDYVSNTIVDDVGAWPTWFVHLVEMELSARLAIPLGDRLDLAQFYKKEAADAFAASRLIDSQGRTSQPIKGNRIKEARY